MARQPCLENSGRPHRNRLFLFKSLAKISPVSSLTYKTRAFLDLNISRSTENTSHLSRSGEVIGPLSFQNEVSCEFLIRLCAILMPCFLCTLFCFSLKTSFDVRLIHNQTGYYSFGNLSLTLFLEIVLRVL